MQEVWEIYLRFIFVSVATPELAQDSMDYQLSLLNPYFYNQNASLSKGIWIAGDAAYVW